MTDPQLGDTVTDADEEVGWRDGVPFIPDDEMVAIASRLQDRWADVLERLGQ